MEFRSVQSLSRVRFFETPWTAACQASLSFTISWSLLKLMSIELVMPSDQLILHRLLLLLPSMSWLFESGGQRIGASASPSVLPMSIRGWFPLGFTDLTSLLSKGLSGVFSQFESISSLALSHLYGPTLTSIHDYRKSIALTIRTFVGKVMSLLFNTLSRLVLVFLPRIKCLLISWLQ